MSLLSRLINGNARESRATPENPSFDLNSPVAWDMFTGGEPVAAGVRVNPKSALSFSPWWRGIALISGDIGKLPFHIVRIEESSRGMSKEQAKEHPAYSLLRHQPNDVMDDLTFKQLLTSHALIYGNGFAYIWRRRGDPTPRELIPLDPTMVEVVRDEGMLFYIYRPDDDEPRRIRAADMLHVYGFGFDGYCGYPVWEYAKQSLGLGLGSKKFQAKRLSSGARPSVVLSTEATLKEDAVRRLRNDWERMHTGLDNSHRTAILDRGIKPHTLSFTAAELQEIETLHMTSSDIANFLGVPVHKIDPLAPGVSTYASVEQENLNYLTEGLDYWMCVWERAARMKLLTQSERDEDKLRPEFDRTKLRTADMKTQAEYWRIATGGRPWAVPDEARYASGLPPITDPEAKADKLLVPNNFGNMGDDNTPKDTESPPAGRPKGRSIEILSEDAVRRATKRLVVHALKAARDPAKFIEFCDRGIDEHRDVVDAILSPVNGVRVDAGLNELPDVFNDVRSQMLVFAETVKASDLLTHVEAWAKQRGYNGTS